MLQWTVNASKIWNGQLINIFTSIRSYFCTFKSKEIKLVDLESSIINATTALCEKCTQNNIIVSSVSFEMSNYNVKNFLFYCLSFL